MFGRVHRNTGPGLCVRECVCMCVRECVCMCEGLLMRTQTVFILIFLLCKKRKISYKLNMAHHSYTDARTKPNYMLKINKAVKQSRKTCSIQN